MNAQRKLVFRKGWNRVVIKPEKAIGVTEKGEMFRYSNWKSACSDCYIDSCMDSLYPGPKYFDSTFFYYRDCGDRACLDNIWTLDSIKKKEIVLRRWSDDTTKFRLDTVPGEECDRYEKQMRKKYKEVLLVESDSATGEAKMINGSYVYFVVTDYDRRTVPLDSLSSITFARAEKCSTFGLGVPLMAVVFAVASPIMAADKDEFNGKFGWPALIFGEVMAGYLTLSMVRNVNSLKVRTYNLDEWSVKAR